MARLVSIGADLSYEYQLWTEESYTYDANFEGANGLRISYTNYHNPSLQDMLLKKGTKWSIPGSLANNWHSGPFKVQRFWYHWEKPSPCCGN
jgi:hypothetical protein